MLSRPVSIGLSLIRGHLFVCLSDLVLSFCNLPLCLPALRFDSGKRLGAAARCGGERGELDEERRGTRRRRFRELSGHGRISGVRAPSNRSKAGPNEGFVTLPVYVGQKLSFHDKNQGSTSRLRARQGVDL